MHSDGRHFSDDPQKYPRGGQDIHFTCPLVTLFHFTVPLLVLLLLLVPKLLLKLCSPEELYLYPILIKKPLDTWHKKYYLILHESFNHMVRPLGTRINSRGTDVTFGPAPLISIFLRSRMVEGKMSGRFVLVVQPL